MPLGAGPYEYPRVLDYSIFKSLLVPYSENFTTRPSSRVVVIFTLFVRIIEISRKWKSDTFVMDSCITPDNPHGLCLAIAHLDAGGGLLCLWNIMKGWPENYEIHTMYASCHVQKNLKYTNIPRTALHSEFYIWNIRIFVTCHLIVVEIFGDFGPDFFLLFNSSPTVFSCTDMIFNYSHFSRENHWYKGRVQ